MAAVERDYRRTEYVGADKGVTNRFNGTFDGKRDILCDGTTDKTEAQFHSGEVAWEQAEACRRAFPWGQKLGADGNLFPVLGGEGAVYKSHLEYPSAAKSTRNQVHLSYGNTNQLVNLTE